MSDIGDHNYEFLFSNLILIIPGNSLILIDFLIFITSLLIEKSIGKKSTFMMTAPNKISYLHQISHVILDRNVAIDPEKTQIHSLYLNKLDKNFFITGKFMNQKNQDSGKNKINSIAKRINIIKKESKEIEKKTSLIFEKSKNSQPELIPNKNDSFNLAVSDEQPISKLPQEINFNFLQKNMVSEANSSFSYSHYSMSNPSNPLTKNENKQKNKYASLAEIHHIDNFGLFEDLIGQKNNHSELYEVLRALSICHDIRSKIDTKRDESFSENDLEKNYHTHEFSSPDTKFILEFAATYKHEFLKQCFILDKQINCYNVLVNEEIKQYYIISKHFEKIGINKAYYKFSLLIKPSIPYAENLKEEIFLEKLKRESPIFLIKTDDPFFWRL